MTHIQASLYLKVLSVSATSEISINSDGLVSKKKIKLVTRAREFETIVLPSGQLLRDVDIHLDLIANINSAVELKPFLKPTDIGYIVHTNEGETSPFIHGAIAWLGQELPYYLLATSAPHYLELSFNNLPVVCYGDDPFVWQMGLGSVLRISSINLSASPTTSIEGGPPTGLLKRLGFGAAKT